MSQKIRILFADDTKLDRKLLKASLRRLAPEFIFEEHSEGESLLARLVESKVPPRILVLDRQFNIDQKKASRYNMEMIALAQDIRKNYPQLDNMAILIYSRHFKKEDAADFSDRWKAKGIWARSKTESHEIMVAHMRLIVSQWPPVKP